MTDEIIVAANTETVVVVGGGPTLSTTVNGETQTVVTEYTEPVIVDLNAGPRGEPGAAILIGAYPPSGVVGVMGDMYIVTQGTVLVGQVFRKTGPSTWTDVGNVRGPAGGVNTVNGYTGPDVILSKSDLGLSNVTNDAQVALEGAQTINGVKTFTSIPVVPDASFAIAKVSGLQSALDLKALDTDVVKLAGSQNILGNKTFVAIPTFSAGFNQTSGNANLVGVAIKTGGLDHGYISYYSRDASPTTRTAYVGVGSAGATDFTVANEMTNGNIVLSPNGTGKVSINSGGGLNVISGTISGNGSGLTALSGSNISTGTVADARLSTNVALLNSAQTISGVKTFSVAPTLSAGFTANGNAVMSNNSVQVFSNGTYGPPTLTTRSAGTKIVIYSNLSATETEYAIGIDTNTLWYTSGQAGSGHKWYTAATNTMSLSSTGVLTASSFVGSGASLTALNASNVTTGTLADARLSANIATKAYVDAIVDAAPGTLDTLNELAAALGDDPNFATTMTNQLALKAPLASPTFTGTVSGITAAMVGLGNVPNVDATNASNIGTGTLAFARLPTGTTSTTVAIGNHTHSQYVDNSTTQTIGGAKTFSATVNASAGLTAAGTFTLTAVGNAAIEIGRQDGTASTPLIDFHSGATLVDYDARISATGGTGSVGGATLNLTAATINLNGNVGLSGTLTGNGSGLTNLNGSALTTGTVAQARLVQNITRIEHGATAGTARPTGATYVEWIGSVQPSNMATGDTWSNTAANGGNPDLYPSGMVVVSAIASATAPSGWYFTEGQQVLISGDTSLYNAVTNNGSVFPYGANTNGAGAAGSTHFRLPDTRGMVIAHFDGTTEFPSIGAVFGTKTVSLVLNQMPSHNHGVTDPGHKHGVSGMVAVQTGAVGQTSSPVASGSSYGFGYFNAGGEPVATTGITINYTGGTSQGSAGAAHNNVQPTIALRYMIKR